MKKKTTAVSKGQSKYGHKAINIPNANGQLIAVTVDQAIQQTYQLLSSRGYGGSIKLATEIYKQVPKYFEAANLVAECCLSGLDFSTAQTCIDKSLALEKNNARGLMAQSKLYRMNDQHEKAIKSLERALKTSPRNEDIYIDLGMIYRELGDDKKILTCVKKALALNPDRPRAYWTKAHIPGGALSEGEIARVEHMLATKQLAAPERYNLLFALARSYEVAGNIDKQMAALMEGNAIKRQSIQYSIDHTLTGYKNLKNNYSKAFIEKNCRADDIGSDIIFVFGFPRSGTTLAEQILSAHKDVNSAGEVEGLMRAVTMTSRQTPNMQDLFKLENEASASIIESIRENYLEIIEPFKKGGVVTDKSLDNFTRIGLMKVLFPQAKIIHAYKNPIDNCLGCFKQIFEGQNWPCIYELNELEQAYRAYHDLMKHWDAMFPGDIYHFSYEALVADQEQQTRALLTYCGLPWDEACLNFHENTRAVRTTSSAQVRQGLYAGAVGRWEKYRDHLGPILKLEDLSAW